MENSQNEIYVTDKTGRIVYVNSKSLNNYGLKPADLIGKNNNDIWRGKWNPPVIPMCIEKRQTLYAEQIYLLTGKTVQTIVTPIFDVEDEIKYILCIVQEELSHYDISYKNAQLPTENETADINRNNKSKFKHEIISFDHQFCKILVQMWKVAYSNIPVLILGESGTGKSLLAGYIHENSPRKERPFVTINCSAIPENLLESELFGYAPYAFTGANPKGKIGLIQMAHTGTLFLDEIGDLAPSLQAKLLDVLENKRFIPVGGNEVQHVDIRIITATNRDLQALVEEQTFREDLFWRISVSTVTVPPLRDRKEDILPLFSYFLKKNNESYGKTKDFSTSLIEALLQYSWPGNIRQLKNLVELLYITASGNIISTNHLPDYIQTPKTENIVPHCYDNMIENMERSVICHYYKKHPSSRALAKALNLTQTKANRLINKFCKDLINSSEQ